MIVQPAQRMGDIQPFYVMELLARAKAMEAAGRDIVHMEVGEPDFVTPPPIVEAGQQALADGRVHYTAATGLPELRAAIAGHYRDEFSFSLDPDRVVVTPGASGALQLLMGTLVNPGDEVLMADPGYPCNRHFVRLYEGHACNIPVGPDSDYQLTAALVEKHWNSRSRAVLLASPSNPTGSCIDPDELARIVGFVHQRGGAVVVDEIYQGLVYATDPQTALSTNEQIFVVNSFSKYFGMTGWRLGWLVAPKAWIADLDKLAQNIFLAPSTPAQYAALAAFEPQARQIMEQRRQAFERRRDYLLPELRRLGFGVPVMPSGAFYIYADCSAFTDDSFAFATRLLEEQGVAITPGRDFGTNNAGRYLRFAYTTGMERLREGMRRLALFLA